MGRFLVSNEANSKPMEPAQASVILNAVVGGRPLYNDGEKLSSQPGFGTFPLPRIRFVTNLSQEKYDAIKTHLRPLDRRSHRHNYLIVEDDMLLYVRLYDKNVRFKILLIYQT